MDKKVLAELEELYSGVEGWTDEERKYNIKFAYDSVMAQRETQAKYGAVDANDPAAVQAAVEQRMAENGGTLTPKPAAQSAVINRMPVQSATPNVNRVPVQSTAPAVTPAPTLPGSIDAGYEEAQKQMEKSVDAATEAAVAEVENSVADANAQLQEQRDAVELAAATAADNSALYAELRGDKGGIGRAQYDSIQNTAARNHAEINRTQTAFARDAAVEIAALQAKGEYEKAEKLLDITQERLSALSKLEQWQAEYAADREEFQEKLRQWQAEYELAAAKVTGITASGALTADSKAKLAALGEAMLKKGLMPSAAQLAAMGMTSMQAREYINRMKAAQG